MKKLFEIENISKYRNILMGIMIINIIIFHYTVDCHNFNYNYHGWILLYNKYIGSSGVDIFLLLSGFGLYYSFKKNCNLKQFYWKRYTKILIPYIIFCVPVLIWKFGFFLKSGVIRLLKEITFYGLFSYGTTLFWYVLMICLCYLIFPYIFKMFDSSKDEMSLQTRLIVLVTATYLFNILLDLYYHSLYNNINMVFLRFVPFVFGVYLGKHGYEKTKIPYSFVVVFILSSLVFLPLIESHSIVLLRIAIALLQMSISLIIILLLNKIDGTKIFSFIKKVLGKVGEYTLELYITHVALRDILTYYGYHTCRIRYYILVVIGSIILSIIIKWLTKLILKLINRDKKEKRRTRRKLAKA